MTYCQQCKKVLPADAKSGICPSCVMGLARGGVAGDVDATRAMPNANEGSESFPRPDELNRLLPSYRVDSQIGQGGMGAVYRAHQPSLDRMVAIKVMSRRFANDPSFAERFAREARTMAKLNHQNIVNVYDYGQVGNACYLVMEYVEGVNLRQAMREGNLTAEQGLAIVPQVCEALQFAHDEGIVHRDIKPENILVDKKGRVKIADFGLAKLVDDDKPSFTLTGSRQVLGTLNYMAPEQIEKPTTVDHRADIYSLGVVLYELLTGELPLGRFQLPGEKFAGHAALDDVVVRTLEKQPDRRFQQASEVRTAVEIARNKASFHPIQPEAATPTPVEPSPPALSPSMPKANDAFARDRLVNHPAPPVKNEHYNPNPRVKFEIENPWHGMTVTKGIISVLTDSIAIDYSKRENVFNSTMFGESGRHLIPFSLVNKVELKEGWFSHSIVLKLDTLDDYPALFAEEPGTLVLNTKASDEEEVRDVVNAIRNRKGQSPLPYVSLKPEDRRRRAQQRLLLPAIGLLIVGIINMAMLPFLLIGETIGDGRNLSQESKPLESDPPAAPPSVSANPTPPRIAEQALTEPASTGPASVPDAATEAEAPDAGKKETARASSKASKTKVKVGFWRLDLLNGNETLSLFSAGGFTIIGLMIFSGGMGMILLRNWGWCFAMAIIAMIPIHPGALFGIPAGILSLIQLNRECNSSQFDKT